MVPMYMRLLEATPMQVVCIISFRDVDRCDKEGKDVALGEGAAQIKELLTYLYEKELLPLSYSNMKGIRMNR